MTTTHRVPAKFYDDHVDRDCLPGVVVARTQSQVTVDLDAEAFADLMSDARYYSDATQFDRSMRGLVMSAQATVRALTR